MLQNMKLSDSHVQHEATSFHQTTHTHFLSDKSNSNINQDCVFKGQTYYCLKF